MKIISKLHKYYLKHFPDIMLFLIGASLILLLKDVPYVNLIILNFDPVFSVILLLWLAYYLTSKPSSIRVLKIAIIIIIIDCLLVLLRSMKIAEFVATIYFVMIFTISVKELLNIRGIIKKQPNLFNDE